jgi:AcrR family transcriptional regulator
MNIEFIIGKDRVVAQTLKEDVRDRILAAGLQVFAVSGYRGASMGAIAEAAGISTGNTYRYYPSKEELFDGVVSPSFVKTFKSLLRGRVKSLDGVSDIDQLDPSALYHSVSEQLMQYTVENRLRMVILLRGSAGSRYEGFADELVDYLSELAVAHFQAMDPRLSLTPHMHINLTSIYRNFVGTLADILEKFEDEDDIRDTVAGFTTYHLYGLKAFFDRASTLKENPNA